MAAKILASKVPKEQKAFGRQVSNFDVDEWNSKCREIVRRGNMAKVGGLCCLADRLFCMMCIANW